MAIEEARNDEEVSIMGPWGPGGTDGIRDGMVHVTTQPWWGGGAAPWLSTLLLIAVLGVLIWGVLRISSQLSTLVAGAAAPAGAPAAPAARPPRDQAMEELRVRYARGDLDRDEYLQRTGDLGGSVDESPSPPPQT